MEENLKKIKTTCIWSWVWHPLGLDYKGVGKGSIHLYLGVCSIEHKLHFSTQSAEKGGATGHHPLESLRIRPGHLELELISAQFLPIFKKVVYLHTSGKGTDVTQGGWGDPAIGGGWGPMGGQGTGRRGSALSGAHSSRGLPNLPQLLNLFRPFDTPNKHTDKPTLNHSVFTTVCFSKFCYC